ncbi:helix-turn-helix domain-containing protein [Oceanobacillus salinisoli]|uniref:helix-turn-helix domain-containing protein n=1 Tax=Oceanobacillus salinisoli TaxID=2678611 RepID=UPI0012E23194|nr:AraC family transcriptional regulator [Oceanobacillus salinisoli]
MEHSIHLPVTNKSFELYYFVGKENQSESYDWLKKHNESAEEFSRLESLFRLHSHDVMEILVFLGGECEFFCEGKTYSLKKGDVVVVPPYAVHKAEVADIHNYDRIILNISSHLLEDYMRSAQAMKEHIIYQKTQGSYVLNLHERNFQRMVDLLHDITQRIRQDEENHSFTLHYLLFQALQIILNPESSIPIFNEKKELDARLAAILDYIESHLTDSNLSLDHVSNYFHLNKYYFSHYFKNNMNLPFYRYVSLKRLSNAVTLIKQNKLSLENIALQCGFPDYSSFYRLFKKEYNLSPKQLQQEHKN